MPLPVWAIALGVILLVIGWLVPMDPRGRTALTVIGIILVVLGGLFIIVDLLGYPSGRRLTAVMLAFQSSPLGVNPLDANAIALIGIPVVGLTQLAKWMALPDRWGPVGVLVFSALGVMLWAYSYGGFHQGDAFNYFMAIITVALSAAGIFGFTRATASAVTALKAPPVGAAQNPTTS